MPIDKVDSVDKVTQDVLKLAKQARNKVGHKGQFEKELEYHANVALRRAFKGMSSGAVAEQMQTLKGDTASGTLTNLLKLAREQQKPSITNHVRGKLKQMQGQRITGTSIRDVEGLLEKVGVGEPARITPSTAYRKKADAWAKTLRNSLKGSGLGFQDYATKSVGGADVAEFFFKGGQSIHIPLSSRVPISNLNYDVFGLYKGIGSDPLSFSDVLIDKIAKGDIDLTNDSARSLSRSVEKLGGLFPRAAPALAGTGIENFYEIMRSKLVNVQIPGGKKTEVMSNVNELLKKGYSLSGGTGPMVNIGDKVSDMVQMSYGFDIKNYMAFGNQFDIGRGLSKWVRPELSFTESATKYMGGRRIKGMTTGRAEAALSGRRSIDLVTLYGREKAFSKLDVAGEGEALVSKRLFRKGVFDVEQFKTHKISVAKDADILAPEVAEFLRTGKPTAFKSGATIGLGFDNLSEVKALSSGIGSEEIVGVKYAKDQEKINIITRRLVKGQSGVKVFDGLKHTLMESDIASAANRLWRKDGSDLIKTLGVDAIVAGDIVVKNPATRSTQMTSALAHMLRQSGANETYIDDIVKGHMKKVGQSAQDSDVARNLFSIAKQNKLGRQDLGLIFGSYAGESLAKTQANVQGALGRKLSMKEIREIHKGRFLGITSVVAGGSELFGDISTGTVEPRTSWMLGSMGPEGQAMGEMIESRRLTQTVGARTEVEKAFASMLGTKGVFTPQQLAGARAVAPGYLDPDALQSIFHQEGTMMKFTTAQMAQYGEALGGQQHMYLPSAERVPGMGTYRQPTGEAGAASLLKHYKSLLTQVTEGKVSPKDITKTMGELQAELQAQHIAPFAGKGQPLIGAVRGQVQTDVATGFRTNLLERISADESSKLTGKSRQFAQGISKAAAEEMFAGMTRQGASPEYIKAQREALQAGRGVPGMIWRHPQIGKYSTLPAMYYMHEGATTGFTVQKGTIEMGLSMDVDADRLGGMFVMNKREEESMRKAMANNKFIGEFENYKARTESMKSSLIKTAIPGKFSQVATVQKAMLGGEIGGATYVMENLYKGAIYEGVRTGDKQLIESMSFLSEYVPQELISAKHLSPAEAEALVDVSGKMLKAGEAKVITGIIAKRFDLPEFQKATGINIRETISRAYTGYEQAMLDPAFEAPETMASFARGKRGARQAVMGLEEFTETLTKKKGTMFGGMLPDPVLAIKRGSTGFSGTETLTSNMKTMTKSQFAGMGKGTAMVAAASTVAGALFYLAAKSREETPFGGYNVMAQQPVQDFQAKPRYVSPDTIQGAQPKDGQIGSPQAIQHTPRAMVDQNTTPMSSVIKIRGTESANVDYNEIAKKITERMKLPSNVNVNINDNSRTITAEMIDRLIEGA